MLNSDHVYRIFFSQQCAGHPSPLPHKATSHPKGIRMKQGSTQIRPVRVLLVLLLLLSSFHVRPMPRCYISVRLHPHKKLNTFRRAASGSMSIVTHGQPLSCHAQINTGIGVFSNLSIRNSTRSSHLQNRRPRVTRDSSVAMAGYTSRLNDKDAHKQGYSRLLVNC